MWIKLKDKKPDDNRSYIGCSKSIGFCLIKKTLDDKMVCFYGPGNPVELDEEDVTHYMEFPE